MTLRDAEKLKHGDKVYWTSPCEAAVQNRVFNIERVSIVGDKVYIVDVDGTQFATYASELSYVN